jgi:hypothetical protein
LTEDRTRRQMGLDEAVSSRDSWQHDVKLFAALVLQ